MKKIKLNKKMLFTFVVASLSMPLFLMPLSLVSNSQDDQNSTSLNLFDSKATKAVTENPNNPTTTPKNLINPKINTSSNIALNTALQYRAEGYNGFALLTSSSTTNKFNQITKFNTSSSNAGTPDWIVKLTDLGALIRVTNENELEIKSIVYSNGNLNENSSLFVLINSVNQAKQGSYLFRINWDTNGSSTKGSYELYKTLTTTKDDVYDVLSIAMLSKNNIVILQNPKISTSGNVTINYKYINYSVSTTTSTITIDSSITSKLSTTSKLINSFYYNANLYLMFQAQSSASFAANNFTFIKITLPSKPSASPITVNSASDIVSLNLSEFFPSIFTDSTTNFLSSNLVDLKSGNYALFLSEKGTPNTTTKGKYVVSKFNLTSLFNGSETFVSKSFLNYPSFGNYFIDVQPYYQNNILSGYIVLDSNNTVSLLNLSFSYIRSLSNFSSTSPITTKAIGNIFNIYTTVNSSNWYAQQTDGYFLEMFDSSIIGQWDKLLLATTELPAIINLKRDEDILNGALYQKVANPANTDYSDEFKAFFKPSTTYQDFLSVIFVDPKLNGNLPKIDITYSAFQSSSNSTYEVELTFTQTLRTINSDGSISENGSSLTLAKKKYTFINANISITQTPKDQLPIFLRNSYASSITESQLLKHFLKVSNASNMKYSLNPNDLLGILDVSVSVPYSWVDGVLKENQIFKIAYGSSSDPLFKINKLFQQDTSVTLFTQEYLDANPQTLAILSNTYGASLASKVSKESFLKDFITFGSAFYNPLNENIITLPTIDNLVITPLDSKGTAYVEMTIPKIGDQIDVFYRFETGSVFYKNPTANEPIYFAFNSNQTVLNYKTTISGGIETTYSTFLPSQLAVNLNSIDKNKQLTELSIYAAYSPYFSSIIHQTSGATPLMTLSAVPNDASGTLKISISLLNPLPTSNETLLEQTFIGFRTQGNVIGTASTFAFGEMSPQLLAKAPSSISQSELISSGVIGITGSTVNLNRKIVLTPNNQQGLLEVKVIFYNWLENNSAGALTIVPVKEFLRVYSGFSQAKDPINAFVWKSFSELDKNYQTLTPEALVNIVNQLADSFYQLEFFCNISTEASDFLRLNPKNISLSLVPNNANGTVEISAKLSGLTSSNSIDVISTTISGFAATSLDPGISWVNDSSDIINDLRKKLPSRLTYSEIGGLYSSINTGNYQVNPTIIYNDIIGLLTIEISLVPTSSSDLTPLTFSKTYSGFATNIPQYKATDWALIFVLPIIIIGVFMIPIALLLMNKYVFQKRKIAKKLDSRLDEEQNNSRKKKEIKSIKDLVDN